MNTKSTKRPLSSLCLVAAIVAANQAQAALLAYYSFDANFSDGSGNANNLTTGGGSPTITTTAAEVKFGGGALDLDYSGDFLSTTSTITFGASDAWTVAFWGKKASGADVRSGMVVGTSANNDFIWTPDNSNVVQGLRFRNSSGASTDYGGLADDAAYHHWVVVADGSGNIRVYRDNVDLGSNTATTTFEIDSVGSGLASETNNYDGQIDELYIFDEAISASVVNSLFTANTIPEPGSMILVGLAGALLVGRRRR